MIDSKGWIGTEGTLESIYEIQHRLERGMSACEDAVPRRGVDCEIPQWWERATKHS